MEFVIVLFILDVEVGMIYLKLFFFVVCFLLREEVIFGLK